MPKRVKSFGKLYRQYRLRFTVLTVAQVAAHLGVTPQYVTAVEHGYGPLPADLFTSGISFLLDAMYEDDNPLRPAFTADDVRASLTKAAQRDYLSQQRVMKTLANVPASMKPTQYVYFIATHKIRSVKIGLSENPYQRLQQLQTAHGHPLKLLGAVVGNRREEGRWHKRFKHLRIKGSEWFHLRPELKAAIEEVVALPAEQAA